MSQYRLHFVVPGNDGPPNPTRTRMVQELRHNSPLLGCRFDPTGRFVFAGAQDNSIQRWQLEGGAKTAFEGHRSWVRALAFASNKLISADYTGRVCVWQADTAMPRVEHSFEAHRGWARALAVSPDGRLLATCGNDHLVKLWNLADFSLVRELAGHSYHVYNVAFHPAGQFLVSADHRGNVKQWEVSSGRETRALDASVLYRYDNTFRADIGGIRGMTFNQDGSLLACSGITDVTNAFAGVGKPVIVLFNWQTGNKTLLRPAANFQGTMWGVGFHPDGFIAGAAGGTGGSLWFWRPQEPQSFHTVALPNNARDLHFHPDNRRLAIPFFDGAVRIYQM